VPPAATSPADPAAFARESLAAYAIGMAASRGQKYQVAPHHRMIARELAELEGAIVRRESRYLMICAPPRHGKSELTSKYFPAWFMGRNPNLYVMSSSYSQEVADDFGRKVLDCMREPFHAEAFPACKLRGDSKSISRFHTTRDGVYYGVGAGAALTSRGAHLLIIDDPIKGSEEAFSETMRRRKQDWFRSDAFSRMMPGGSVIVMNTRWHEDDLSGFCLREMAHLGWRVLSLPAVAEADDPLGRAVGDALWPEAYPLDRLKQIEKAQGSYFWSALYQQRPQPESGGMLKRGWWKYYGGDVRREGYRSLPTRFDEIVISWDCTFKGGDGTDFVVGTVWGRAGTDYFLLDLVRDRMDFPATLAAVVALAAKWPRYSACLIEDKANGPAVIATLAKKIARLIAVNPEGGKVARAAAVAGLIEAGNVYLPDASIAPWVGDFVGECAAFPTGKHDDQVDSTTQALARMSTVARPARGVVRTWGAV
jgi:predicted phage terminase large subunit-like protein